VSDSCYLDHVALDYVGIIRFWWLARLGGSTFDAFGRALGFRPPFTRSDVEKPTTDTVCGVSKIRSLLGFQSQYGLEEGVRRTVQWYREEQARQKGSR